MQSFACLSTSQEQRICGGFEGKWQIGAHLTSQDAFYVQRKSDSVDGCIYEVQPSN